MRAKECPLQLRVVYISGQLRSWAQSQICDAADWKGWQASLQRDKSMICREEPLFVGPVFYIFFWFQVKL